MEPSRSRIDRAGRNIRHAAQQELPPAPEDLAVVETFRHAHVEVAAQLNALLDELRAELSGLAAWPLYHVASRPKTRKAIVAKLCRSTTNLSRMQDIAGARLVVPTIEQQDVASERLAAELRARDSLLSIKDRRAHPDVLGYRAIHLVLSWQGRFAEIQLRTILQQMWAQAVEQFDEHFATDLKHGNAPPEWVQWYRDLSVAIRAAEDGEPLVPPMPPSS